MSDQREESATPFAIWEVAGTTEHLGGVSATRLLLDLCHIVPGQVVLDVGCGTGYTARLLATRYGAHVLAADVRLSSLQQSGAGASRAGVAGQINLLRADAHHLPCSDSVLDAVVAESVLAFCDSSQAAAEFCRILKPGGICALNELTLLAPAPQELTDLLEATLGIRSYQSHDWQSILSTAGLLNVTAAVRRMSLREQLSSHLQVDGLSGYLQALRKGLANAQISRVFINKAMLKAAWKFAPLIGYGLYTGTKPL